jgi:hypothetical protein
MASGSRLAMKIASLLERQIINEPRRARSLLKALGLLGRRVKPVAKSSLNHALFLNENGHANNRAAAESAK